MCTSAFTYSVCVCVCTPVAKAVSAINQAVEGGDAEATLEALKAPAANLRSITDTCAKDYASSLAQARQQKAEAGAEAGDGWTEHRTREGHSFYYNWKSGESQWGRPEELPEQNAQLSRDEIQVCTYISLPPLPLFFFSPFVFLSLRPPQNNYVYI